MLQRAERRGTGPSVLAGNENHVRMGLGNTGRDGPDTHLGHQLHVDASGRVRVLEVVDELGQVLDRIDVVVRRRGDQPDAGGRVPGLCYPRVDLVARELAAFAGLGSLGDLDLEVVRIHQVLAGDPEAARSHLLDRAAPQVAVRIGHVARGVLASLTCVRPGTEAVHRNRERLVCLSGDRPVRHGAGRKAPHDGLDRLHLLEGDRWPHRSVAGA